MAKPQSKPPSAEPRQIERFVRIVELPMKPGDTLRGYQTEIIQVEGDKVIARKLVDKPNLFEYAYSHAGDLIDPRNESHPDA